MQTSKPLVETPTLKRRLICLVYEAFLLVAVCAFGMLLFLLPTQKMSPEFIAHGSQITLFVVAGIYFIHAWTGSGHTLAMKTWRIKIVMLGHARVPFRAAALRYVFAWGWIFPGIAVGYFAHLSRGMIALAIGVNIIAWGLTVFLDKDRQFLHDKLAGTRLISLPKMVKAGKTPAASAG